MKTFKLESLTKEIVAKHFEKMQVWKLKQKTELTITLLNQVKAIIVIVIIVGM